MHVEYHTVKHNLDSKKIPGATLSLNIRSFYTLVFNKHICFYSGTEWCVIPLCSKMLGSLARNLFLFKRSLHVWTGLDTAIVGIHQLNSADSSEWLKHGLKMLPQRCIFTPIKSDIPGTRCNTPNTHCCTSSMTLQR